MLKKNFIIFFLIILFFYGTLLANDKLKIINNLNQTKTIKFDFIQRINEEVETGYCFIMFPGLLKCNYNDSKQKELIINKSSLAITQKRYSKTYYYPISNSPFLNILNKVELIKLVESSELFEKDDKLILSSSDDNNQVIKIFFDKQKKELIGWEVVDQFGKKINFSIDILEINENLKKSFFDIPKLN